MSLWVWMIVLLVAVWAAHWGAERLAPPLRKVRRQWGLTEVAGAALVGIATASPEVGISTASAARDVTDIGLGTALGTNIIAIPLVVTVAYWASRRSRLGNGEESVSDHGDHVSHRREGLLRLPNEAVTVQAISYLGVISLVALLTLPKPWRGLQPVDGWVLLAAYLAYLAQAFLRGRKEKEQVEWSKQEIGLAVAGVASLAAGAYFTVSATKAIVAALGIPEVIGGLFITTPVAALPEIFAVRSLTRSGQVTAATTSVLGDHAVSLTLAFVPLALVTTPVSDFQLFWVNLCFVALVPGLFAAMVHWGSREHGLKLWQVMALDGVYLLYLLVMLFGVLNVL